VDGLPLEVAIPSTFACSGPPEVVSRLIGESIEYGRVQFALYAGIGLIVLITHRRSPIRLHVLAAFAIPLLLHPTWWDQGSSGDCGMGLRMGALGVTVYGILVGVGIFLWDFFVARRRSISR
jgi:hypothetical protein